MPQTECASLKRMNSYKKPSKSPRGLPHAATVPSLPFASKGKKAKPKKPLIKYDEYGAREDATPEDQVKAMVNFFHRMRHQNGLKVMPGKPKPAKRNQPIAIGSDKYLYDVLKEHVSKLEVMI